MSRRKSKHSPETVHFINSAPRIDRWQLCQKIGKVYYDSAVSHETLAKIKQYLETSGVLVDTNFKELI